MDYTSKQAKLQELYSQLEALRQEFKEVQQSGEPQPADNYTFANLDGEISLADCFGDKDYLYVVHNMGTHCSYCTLWMDGFTGFVDHIQSHVSFVVSSPDDPQTQADFAASRNWPFPMVSVQGSAFADDMGFTHEGDAMPGVSVFQKSAKGGIERVSGTFFGPGDPFCSVFHLWDMLPADAPEWQPQFSYE